VSSREGESFSRLAVFFGRAGLGECVHRALEVALILVAVDP
jgi:hypothetical protein